LSVLGWLGMLFALTRRPRGWLLFSAALIIYPIPYYLAYPTAKYRHAIEPELILLSVYLAFVVWVRFARSRIARLDAFSSRESVLGFMSASVSMCGQHPYSNSLL